MGFFDRPDNYDKMLDRMAIITGILVLVSSAFAIQALSASGITLPSPKALASHELTFLGFKGSFWSLLPSALAVWIFRRARMHDRVSDLLKIREAFDTHVILSRLAGEVGLPVGLRTLAIFRNKRHDLMYPTFYEYVDAHNPKISKHHVMEALDAWFGYWIAMEAVLVLIPFAVFFALLDSMLMAVIYLGLSLLCAAVSLNYFKACAPLAEREIKAMTDHPNWPQWKEAIREHFDRALQN